ncbi:pyridoxal-phosphate dependent enzyme [Micromonospora sp. NPDC047548]|uniref:pyridoxal-phosphate dependent enzyme n=1 Tax=Micromonospora sp. NPDC047548 TaxID=3155624 RepID=UPI00340C4FAE
MTPRTARLRGAHRHAPSVSLQCAGGHVATDPTLWRCPDCEAPWELATSPEFDPRAIDTKTWSLWRYAAMLPAVPPITLGEGGTPLVQVAVPEGEFLAKLEFLSPTGSYKDRGTAVVVSHLRALGIEEAVEDSSGNAGASLAAYAAAAGVRARVFVPAHAGVGKKRQIAEMGAEVVEVVGGRGAAAAACRRETGAAAYASHCWNPLFLSGQSTCAWEIWEQLGGSVPDAVVCPVGQGNLFLGLARGFAVLRRAGLVAAVPRMYAVQSAACAPVAQAWRAGWPQPVAVDEGVTIAEGILTSRPVRGDEILRVLRRTGGAAVIVADDEVRVAQRHLRGAGLSVEPTSAVAVAALPLLRDQIAGAQVVVPLTGSGLKTL